MKSTDLLRGTLAAAIALSLACATAFAGDPNLFDAVKSGDIEAVKKLIAGGASVSETNGNGDAALVFAAAKNNVKMAGVLIENGAEVNASNKEGWTALMSAVDRGNIEMVRFLLAKGANAAAEANLKGAGKRTPIKIAKLRKREEIAKFLEAAVKNASGPGGSGTKAEAAATGAVEKSETAKPDQNEDFVLKPREPQEPVTLIRSLDALDQEMLGEIAGKFIPEGAELSLPVYSDEKKEKPKVFVGRAGANGEPVAAVPYRASAGNIISGGIVFLAKIDGRVVKVYERSGESCAPSLIVFADVEGAGRMAALVGYFGGGSAGSELEALAWRDGALKVVATDAFHHMDVEDMPDRSGKKDGKAEIALWSKDTGAFKFVEVKRFVEGKGLVAAEDATPYYFRKEVVPYYEKLMKDIDDDGIPRKYMYMAEAELRAEMFEAAKATALKGIEKTDPKVCAPESTWAADFKAIVEKAEAGLKKK